MMKKHGPAWFLGALIFLTLLFPAGVPAQTSPADVTAAPDDGESMPHVSELQAEARNNLVRLTWKDAPAARGPVFIYRSNVPFNSATFVPGRLRPLEVPYGVESYIDETEGAGWVYYLVAASSNGQEGGGALRVAEVYHTILPPANTIGVDARFEAPEIPILAAPGSPALGISALRAVIEGEGVTISYQVSDSLRNTVLYRSVQPIQRADDLLRAVVVQSGLTPPFIDYPVPGIPYYYAVIFEDELPRGSVGIFPGINATTEAVALSTRSGRVGLPGPGIELRSMPLPLMSLNYAVPGIDSFTELSAPIPLGPQAAKAIANTPKSKPEIAAPKKPRVFSQDLSTEESGPGSGGEYGLKVIVQGPFLSRNWEMVIAELRRYLSLPRSDLAAARARFYLGQSLYFSAKYREALFEFLMVKTQFPTETNEWISAALEALVSVN